MQILGLVALMSCVVGWGQASCGPNPNPACCLPWHHSALHLSNFKSFSRTTLRHNALLHQAFSEAQGGQPIQLKKPGPVWPMWFLSRDLWRWVGDVGGRHVHLPVKERVVVPQRSPPHFPHISSNPEETG